MYAMLDTVTLSDVARLLGKEGPFDDSVLSDAAYDSRQAGPGSLFFCLRGNRSDGHYFAADAEAAGARAIVCEHPTGAKVPEIIVEDSRAAMNLVASPFFGEPSKRLEMFGITGTNGKTTTCFMVDSVFAAAGRKTGLIGTVHNSIAGETTPAMRTTPESVDLQRLLRAMVDADATHAAVEVTSIGLEEGRIRGTAFDVAAFTNLTRDHLEEYHGTMEAYFSAKKKLFTDGYADRALVNIDDPYGADLYAQTTLSRFSYGVSQPADFTVDDLVQGPHGSSFTARGPGFEAKLSISMPGPFNVSNALCAAAAAHLMGFDSDAIEQGLMNMTGVPGRFESVDMGQPFAVIVDYAHTPDSLMNILAAGRKITSGRLVAVFGCGGDRDRPKRALMGEVAATAADVVIATSDNPRSEEPESILAQIESGLERRLPKDGYRLIVDREEAITDALQNAQPGDVVVIAGKGHETGQEFADEYKIDFDDRIVARRVLARLGWGV